MTVDVEPGNAISVDEEEVHVVWCQQEEEEEDDDYGNNADEEDDGDECRGSGQAKYLRSMEIL